MSRRVAAWLAWSLAGLSVAMFVGGIALYVLTGLRSPRRPGGRTYRQAVDIRAFPRLSPGGTLIASRRSENPIGWICLAGLFWMSFALGDASNTYELARIGKVTSSVKLDALLQGTWVPPVGLLGIYMILLFPDGKLPSRRWRPFAWFAGAVMVLIPVVFVPGPLEDHPGVRNPFGLEGYPWLQIVACSTCSCCPYASWLRRLAWCCATGVPAGRYASRSGG